tara:strand:- start:306 stop:824 length:519 start_codon:yes stop_codon:yes gene_type:complete
MHKEFLSDYINPYPDFPKKGVIFRDILPILRKPDLFEDLIKKMSNSDICQKAEAILAIDARGFLFGTGIALNLSKPLILARKAGKLPGELITDQYVLEYGNNSLSIQVESIKDFYSYAIVDDLLATGGTAKAVSNLLKSQNKNITGLTTVIELKDLDGRKEFKFPVSSQIIY